MEFIDGCFKLDDMAALGLHDVDVQALLEKIVHVWCYQLFRCNLANVSHHSSSVLSH